MTGGKMTLSCTNDMELQTMKGKYAGLITDVYTSFGFPRPVVDFKLTEEDSGAEAAREAFMAQRLAEEEAYGKKALDDLKLRETSQKESGTVSGPFRLGTPIKPG